MDDAVDPGVRARARVLHVATVVTLAAAVIATALFGDLFVAMVDALPHRTPFEIRPISWVCGGGR